MNEYDHKSFYKLHNHIFYSFSSRHNRHQIALGYENIRNYIGLSDDFESSNPVPEEKLKNLQEVMDWIFGSKMRDVKRCVVTQNPDLRKLVEILGNDLSVSALKASGDINIDELDIKENSRIEAKSGDVTINNNVCNCYVEAETNSGDKSINKFDRKSEIELKIKTTSGDISVN